jgi:hypothetical protein
MTDNREFYTATMAKVYAEQGHYEKAGEIFQYLLTKDPENQAIKAALSELEAGQVKLEEEKKPSLNQLFSKWLNLVMDYKKIQDMKKLANINKKENM